MNYRQNSAVNWSKLKHITSAPRYFKYLLDGGTEKEKDEYKLGSAFHAYVLEPELYKQLYAIQFLGKCDNSVRKVIHQMFVVETNPVWEDDKILFAAKLSGFQANWGDEAKLKKIKGEGKEYFDFMDKHKASPKEYLSTEQVETIQAMKAVCKKSDMFQWHFNSHINAYNEKELYVTMDGLNYKAKLDRIIIDEENKTCYLVDLKTTGDYISKFKSTIYKYGYNLQIAFYRLLLQESGLIPYDYEIKCRIVAVETFGDHDIGIVEFKDETMISAEIQVIEAIELYKWHLENKVWSPKEYTEVVTI